LDTGERGNYAALIVVKSGWEFSLKGGWIPGSEGIMQILYSVRSGLELSLNVMMIDRRAGSSRGGDYANLPLVLFE